MKPCYEGLKEIGVDVNEIWRKMLCFRVRIGLLPLILIISWNETVLWRFERNRSWCWWEVKKTVWFSVCLWLFIWTVILLDPLLFLLDRCSCVFSRVGVVGVGGVWIHLLLLLHIYTLPIIWLHWLLSRPCLTLFMNWLLSRPCLTLFMNWLLSRPLFVVGWVVVGVGRGRGR